VYLNGLEVICMGCKCEGKIKHGRVEHGKRVQPKALRESLHADLLRLLGMNRGYEEPLSVHEEIGQISVPGGNYCNYGREIETALLEAERRKAEALMELQKRRFIC
jgi:predicted component of type VI protein secretion system